MAAFCWPYLNQLNVWAFLVFIGITHYTQDWAKIKFTEKSKRGLFFFIVDQTFHILFISAIFLTSLKNIKAPLNNSGGIIAELYNNDALILYFTALIVVSYMAHFIIIIFKSDYLEIKGAISSFEKRYGFIERIIIFSAMLAGNLWLISIPLTLTLRPLLVKTLKQKLNVSKYFSSLTEIILSGAIGILTGLIFNTLI